jgi:hypothetical protein
VYNEITDGHSEYFGMAVQVYWYDYEETTLFYYADPQWQWTDYYQLMTQIRALVVPKEYRVRLIADFSACPSLPKDALLHFRYLSDQLPDNLRLVVMIGAHPEVRQLYTAFRRVYGKLTRILDMRFVGNLEEAVHLLARERTQ